MLETIKIEDNLLTENFENDKCNNSSNILLLNGLYISKKNQLI
jgi:hypothetical protein